MRATAWVVGALRRSVRLVDFYVGRRRVARDRRAPFTRMVAGHGRRGARLRIMARAVLRDGRARRSARTARACAGRRGVRFTG
jgi:hypothetical protein